ncbi:hypothetical protein SO694_000671110 [Aureococcus anophagefferens]|uniref:Uncharacterized protein n=1 Tax=Aureococcus anophagefferens TaxID=44056 RepID=A0ABR1FQI9_AURAN
MHRFSRLMVFDLSGNLLTGDLDAAYDSKRPAETLRTAKLARNALTGSLPAPANLPEGHDVTIDDAYDGYDRCSCAKGYVLDRATGDCEGCAAGTYDAGRGARAWTLLDAGVALDERVCLFGYYSSVANARASMIWGTIGVIESDVVCADVGYECAEGYGNTLCERAVEPGYYKFGYYNPEACPDEPDMRKVFAAGVSAAFFVGYLVLHSFLETVPSINLIIYFLQLAGIALHCKFPKPDSMHPFGTFLNVLLLDLDVLAPTCWVDWSPADSLTRLRPRGLRARALEEAEKQPHISSGLNSLANWAWFYLLALAAASVGLLEDGGRGTVIVFQPDADWRTVYARSATRARAPRRRAGGRAIKEHAKHQARNRNKHVLRRYARSSGTKRKSPAPEDAVAAGGTPGCGEDWLAALKYAAEVAATAATVAAAGRRHAAAPEEGAKKRRDNRETTVGCFIPICTVTESRNKPKVAPEKADLAASLGIDGDGAEENKAEDGDAEGAPVDEGGDAEGAPVDEGGDAEGAPVDEGGDAEGARLDEDEVILEEGDASPVPRLLV